MMAKEPAVATQFAVYGFDLIGNANKPNAATMYVDMKDWSERTATAEDVIKKLFDVGSQQPDGLAIAFNPPDHPWAG